MLNNEFSSTFSKPAAVKQYLTFLFFGWVRMGSSQVDRLIGGEKNLSHLDHNAADQVGRFIAPVGGIG